MTMKSTSATSLSICLGVLLLATAIVPSAEATAWVVSMQNQWLNSFPVIQRYDNWLEGAPRRVAWGYEDLGDALGNVCDSSQWSGWGNLEDNWGVNCAVSPDQVSAKSGNVGFTVGTLALNGAAVATCSVTAQLVELCDSDTTSTNPNCLSYLECV